MVAFGQKVVVLWQNGSVWEICSIWAKGGCIWAKGCFTWIK